MTTYYDTFNGSYCHARRNYTQASNYHALVNISHGNSVGVKIPQLTD